MSQLCSASQMLTHDFRAMKKRKLESLQSLRIAKLNNKAKQKSLHTFFGSSEPKKVKEERSKEAEVKIVDLVSDTDDTTEEPGLSAVEVSKDESQKTETKFEVCLLSRVLTSLFFR